jgi:hypothetical protein
MQTDLTFPVTTIKDGPRNVNSSRPKVFYLMNEDVGKLQYNSITDQTVLKLKKGAGGQKLVLAEAPDEFRAMQALSQGATNSAVFTKHYQNLAPTSSATASDQSVASKYYNEVNSVNGGGVRLPDPFVRRLVVIENMTTGSVVVRARGTTGVIDGSTGAYTIAAGKRIHFLAPTAATAGTTAPWKTAIDV